MSTIDCSSGAIGIDSLNFVHNIIAKLLYPKPATPIQWIKDLELKPRTKLYFIGNKKYNIVTCFYEIKAPEPTDKLIIFSHGNACDIYSMHEYLSLLSTSLNVNVVCYDYP